MQVFLVVGCLDLTDKKETLGGGTSVPSKGFDTLILSHFLINVNTFTLTINENNLLNTRN